MLKRCCSHLRTGFWLISLLYSLQFFCQPAKPFRRWYSCFHSAEVRSTQETKESFFFIFWGGRRGGFLHWIRVLRNRLVPFIFQSPCSLSWFFINMIVVFPALHNITSAFLALQLAVVEVLIFPPFSVVQCSGKKKIVHSGQGGVLMWSIELSCHSGCLSIPLTWNQTVRDLRC